MESSEEETMNLPYDPTNRERAIALIRERFGDRVARQTANLDDDLIEELVFRISCGEY
jgi:hypothetical protein